jgi:S-(hydroxymethyl)glutathione dehydrogenase/alcohol dehydrogenase
MEGSMEGQVITCKAAVAWAPGQPLSIEDIQVEPPRAGEVRVKLTTAGLCHTDATLYQGDDLGLIKPTFPFVAGHEGCGVVESVGEGVDSVQPGDHVVLINVPQCRKCELCLSDKTNACVQFTQNIGHGYIDDKRTTRFRCGDKQLHHCIGTSTFSEYTVCCEFFVTKVNPDADLEKICQLSCGFLTGYGAALNDAKVEPGSICGVWGLGSVGMSCVLGCKKAGAKRIIVVEPNEQKFELAKQLGATDCLNPTSKASIEDQIFDMTNGHGLDFALECVGDVKVMRQAFNCTNCCWGLLTVAGGSSIDEEFCVGSAINFVYGRKINGSWVGGFKTRDGIARLVDQYVNGELPLDDFISNRMGLDDIQSGFDNLLAGKSVKSVINF